MEEYWANLTDGEKMMFQRVCRRLLTSTFIVRDRDEENRKEYFFVARDADPVNTYFGYIGMQITVDRDTGVVMLRNGSDAGDVERLRLGHLMLRKQEALMLMVLGVIYQDRISSGRLSRAVIVTLPELRMEMEKYGVRGAIDKTGMTDILRRLSQYALLDTKGQVGDEDFTIRLYPSLLFCMDTDAFARFVATMTERLKDEGGNGSGAEETEETYEEDEETEENGHDDE